MTVRLTQKERGLLDQARRRLGRSRSDLVREAIVEYTTRRLRSDKRSIAERWAKWIGCVDLGGQNLSENTGERFRRLLLEKHARRDRR